MVRKRSKHREYIFLSQNVPLCCYNVYYVNLINSKINANFKIKTFNYNKLQHYSASFSNEKLKT